MSKTIAYFRLPAPPTVNNLNRNRSAKERAIAASKGYKLPGRARTEAYKQWINDAGWTAKIAKQPKIFGRYGCHISIPMLDPADIDGRIKPILDLMQNLDQTGNDKLCRSLSVSEDETVPLNMVDVVLTSLEAEIGNGSEN